MKRILTLILGIILVLTLVTPALAAKVVLSPQSLIVDGKPVDCEKYNIDGSNYFKLRDIAFLLNGTESQFEVGYDEKTRTVTVTSGLPYTANGGELKVGEDKSSSAVPSTQTILINGTAAAGISAYNLAGNNFFKLRDLGTALGFTVDYDAETNSAIILSGKPAEPQRSELGLTEGKPVGEAEPVKYSTINGLADGKTGTIHLFTAQPLDNGYIRFSIEYTVPEKLNIHVFNPPSGSALSLRDNGGTPSGKGTLVFDVSSEELAAFSEITIKFFNGDSSCFYVFYKTDQEPVQTGIALSEGKPVGEAEPVKYSTRNELADGKTGTIHLFTAQPLDNGYIRFTVEYTVPEKLRVHVFDPPGGSALSLWDTGGTPSGKGTLVFDVSGEELAAFSEIAIVFTAGESNSFYVFYQIEQEQVQTGLGLTEGNPVGEAEPVKYSTSNELADGKTGTIHLFTAQPLDNGYIRFTVKYTVPEKMNIFIFNPPDGDKLRLRDTGGTPGGNGTLVFDLSGEDLAAFSDITINFYTAESDRFFVFFQTDQVRP